MIDCFMGIEYSRGACAVPRDGGPALAPAAIKKMFPNTDWTTVIASKVDIKKCAADRFGENAKIQEKIYSATPFERHIMIGGDHSVNFGHFAAIADRTPNKDLCLVYIDAHLDIHTPKSSQAQASGAPHGTNVRALLGDGDARWLKLQSHIPALRPENLFYLGTRSYEPAEIEFVQQNKIFVRTPADLRTSADWHATTDEIIQQIKGRPFIVSFDFDCIDPIYFPDVWVPEPGGLTPDCVKFLLQSFKQAIGFEFVEYAPSGDEKSATLAYELISMVRGF